MLPAHSARGDVLHSFKAAHRVAPQRERVVAFRRIAIGYEQRVVDALWRRGFHELRAHAVEVGLQEKPARRVVELDGDSPNGFGKLLFQRRI